MEVLRSELLQLREKHSSEDPNAADPHMAVLVTLRERLRHTNLLLFQLVAMEKQRHQRATKVLSPRVDSSTCAKGAPHESWHQRHGA